MKKTFGAFFFLLAFSVQLIAQSGTWTWMHGSTLNNPLGNFGTMGVPDPNNVPPGMYEPASWTDLNGNFWIFGGYSPNNMRTSLWKFDPVANVWTWMKGPSAAMQPGVYGTMGIADPANYPGCRAYGCVTWTDDQNNLWLFGGFGYDGFSVPGMLNDLWKYNIATNEWTWMNGSNTSNPAGSYGTQGVPAPSNQPPGRCSFTGWKDNAGDLWFFGGYNFNTLDCYDDMWRYSMSSNTWTWMNGTNTLNSPPVYGVLQQAASTNSPGGRTAYSRWTDSTGIFWMYGGLESNNYSFGDMWRFDPAGNSWTWMGGTSLTDDTAHMSQTCRTSLEYPRARGDNAVNWTDACGRMWSYSGVYILGQQAKYPDDVWSFDPATNLFDWTDGTQLQNQPPNYGTILVPAASNTPGGNSGGVSFQDLQGNFWFFGGDLPPVNIQLKNAMWKYVADTNCVKYLSSLYSEVPDTVCAGSAAFFSSSLNNPGYNVYWDFGNPADPNAFSNQAQANYTYSDTGSFLVTVWFVPQNGCLGPDRDTFRISVIDPESRYRFPNVFTPNGDLNDDEFPGFTETVDGYRIEIFDRWGNPVFETTDATQNWNGKKNGNSCQDGVYFWIANLNDCRGNPIQKKGFVELIR